MRFKLYFQNLTKFQKLEVYVLVIVFYSTILYFYDDFVHNFKSNNIQKTEVIKYKNELNSLHSKIKGSKNTNFVDFVEEKSNKNNIFLESIIVNNKILNLQLSGKFSNMMNLLNIYQTHMKILGFKIVKHQGKIYCDLKIEQNYFFNKDILTQKLQLGKDPFANVKLKSLKKQNKKTVIVVKPIIPLAIISNEVLIDGSWYVVGDVIENYKILSIDDTKITIKEQESNSIKTIKVINE